MKALDLVTEIPLGGFEWETEVSDLQMKEVTVTNTWVMDSHGTRGEAELAATVEAAGEGEGGVLTGAVTGVGSEGVGFCSQERKTSLTSCWTDCEM